MKFDFDSGFDENIERSSKIFGIFVVLGIYLIIILIIFLCD